MDVKKILIFFVFFAFAGIAGAPALCMADTFNMSDTCDASVSGSGGSVDCSSWQRGSKTNYKGIDVATCICVNTCLTTPANHYYYDDPVNKTKQEEGNVKLPVVLAWDEVPGWKITSGDYIWDWPAYPGASGKESATADIFAVRSYLLEIDNTNNDINDSKSAGGIYRKILTTNEFNPQELFYPCFFNSATTYKWRVRPCCNADGSNCQLEDNATWWTFTTSAAPEPIDPDDPDWNGSGGAASLSYDGMQIKWCKVYFQKTKKYATSYKLNVTSDESGSQACHPLLELNGQCKDDDIFADAITGKVHSIIDTDGISKIPFPTTNQGRQDHALFTRDRTYTWKLRTCYDEIARDCSDYGQKWTFSTKHDPIGVPTATSPKNNTAGNDLAPLPLSLSWTMPNGANSFVYETSFSGGAKNSGSSTVPNAKTGEDEKALFDADTMAADTVYQWRVKACSNYDSSNCDGWSEWFSFRTTGRPPKAGSLVSEGNIPITLSWESIDDAKSYNLSLQEAGSDAKIILLKGDEMMAAPEYAINYPVIDQGRTYYWKVQTCAHDDGTVCGDWSAENSFATGELDMPVGNSPTAGDTIYADQLTQELSWSEMSNAKAYHYILTLANSTDASDCDQDTIEGTTNKTSATVKMNCLGEYTLAVEACVDSQCQSVSPKGEWNFTLDQHEPQTKSSFAVCGASYDNPDTGWNERAACEPKHAAIMVKVILDFLLFKLSVFLMPFLIAATAFLYYSPFKTPDVIDKVKTAWKAIGIGYALLFCAWVIVGVILSIVGFSGLWWKIL